MTKLSTLKRKMLADPEARKEYERLGPEFEISSELGKPSGRDQLISALSPAWRISSATTE